jgi:hypothetical protein
VHRARDDPAPSQVPLVVPAVMALGAIAVDVVGFGATSTSSAI